MSASAAVSVVTPQPLLASDKTFGSRLSGNGSSKAGTWQIARSSEARASSFLRRPSSSARASLVLPSRIRASAGSPLMPSGSLPQAVLSRRRKKEWPRRIGFRRLPGNPFVHCGPKRHRRRVSCAGCLDINVVEISFLQFFDSFACVFDIGHRSAVGVLLAVKNIERNASQLFENFALHRRRMTRHGCSGAPDLRLFEQVRPGAHSAHRSAGDNQPPKIDAVISRSPIDQTIDVGNFRGRLPHTHGV
jgi:hypothetical protein